MAGREDEIERIPEDSGTLLKRARFWTRARVTRNGPKGRPIVVEARGWSNESLDAARAVALQIAERLWARIASGSRDSARYPYGDRPLPEPVVREFFAPDGTPSAIVTRNVYGALVLNTARLMFVDVDRPPQRGSPWGKLGAALFGAPLVPQTPVTPELTKIRSVLRESSRSGRIYETAAGYRVLVLGEVFEPGSEGAESLLRAFGSDPLYVRLCSMQQTFRARLTPKPWRLRMSKPPVLFPFESPEAEGRMAAWLEDYDPKCESFATCRFLEAIGSTVAAAEFDELVRYHDAATRATSGLRLA